MIIQNRQRYHSLYDNILVKGEERGDGLTFPFSFSILKSEKESERKRRKVGEKVDDFRQIL